MPGGAGRLRRGGPGLRRRRRETPRQLFERGAGADPEQRPTGAEHARRAPSRPGAGPSALSAGLLFAGILGVLAMTAEYPSGMIRATLAVIPDRRMLLAAKAAVFGSMTLVVGEATAFLAFVASRAAVRGQGRRG